MRGDLESRSITQVLDEAKRLAEAIGENRIACRSKDNSAEFHGLVYAEKPSGINVKIAILNNMTMTNDDEYDL